MRRYSGYLTVSDLDGTLIDSKQKISRRNIEAITEYVEEGGLFAIATGRSELNIKPFIKNININCPCILYNGAIIYDLARQQFIKSVFLDNAHLVEPLKEIISNYKNVCMQISIQGTMFIVSSRDTVDPAVIRENQPFELACIDDISKERWVKILLYDTNRSLKSIGRFLNDRIAPGVINIVSSAAEYLEILVSGVSKGSALLDLMNIMKVSREKVIAIGDYCNDIEMVQAAGLGVATGNAHDLLKDAARITSVSNDEHAIYNLFKIIVPDYELTSAAGKKPAVSVGDRASKNFST